MYIDNNFQSHRNIFLNYLGKKPTLSLRKEMHKIVNYFNNISIDKIKNIRFIFFKKTVIPFYLFNNDFVIEDFSNIIYSSTDNSIIYKGFILLNTQDVE